MRLLFILTLFISAQSFAQTLPAVFYAGSEARKEYCQNKSFHNEKFWRALMREKINSLTHGRPATVQNSYVTKSYLELFERTHEMNGVKFMGYIYANASHHLGRLVRYNAWPDDHKLKEYDRSFVEGQMLRTVTQVFNGRLSTTLMSYSKDLYEQLSWSLGSASICGLNYTLKMVKDPYLQRAFRAPNIAAFIESFVSFEQTYLHYKMYQNPEIKIPAMITLLDNMRYMSFNGEKHTSFAKWCEKYNCRTSSYDLENRIRYDVWAISNELALTKANEATLKKRLKNAKVQVTADYFIP